MSNGSRNSDRRSEFIDRLSGLVLERCCGNRRHSAIHIEREVAGEDDHLLTLYSQDFHEGCVGEPRMDEKVELGQNKLSPTSNPS